MGLMEISVSIIVASVLAGVLISSLLRRKCNTATRAGLGIVGGLCCLFLLGAAAFVWTISNIGPSKTPVADDQQWTPPQQQPKPVTDTQPTETIAGDTYKETTGSISLPFRGQVELNLRKVENARAHVSFKGNNGSVVVPPGSYHFVHYTLMANDENGSPLYLYGDNSRSSQTAPITVAVGKTQKLKVGPPFTAWIDVKQKNDRVSMSFNMTGSNNEKCVLAGTDGKAPGFQVLSQSGEILQTGSFEYG